MAVDLVAVPGEEGENAYADADTAVAYAESRIPDVNTRAFLELDDEQQSQALITARRDIDSTIGFSFELEDGEYPEAIVNASIELALSYALLFADTATADPLNPSFDNGNTKVEHVEGAVRIEYFAPGKPSATGADRFPPIVQRLLDGYITSARAHAWGSAEVVRGS